MSKNCRRLLQASVDSVSVRFRNVRVEKMPLNIRIQWNVGAACMSECVLKTLASRLSFLLQNPRTQKGFRRVFEGVSKGSLKGFWRVFEGVLKGPRLTPSETLLKPFRDPYRDPFSRGFCGRKWKSWPWGVGVCVSALSSAETSLTRTLGCPGQQL